MTTSLEGQSLMKIVNFVDESHNDCKVLGILKKKDAYPLNVLDSPPHGIPLISVDKIVVGDYQRPEDFDENQIKNNINDVKGFRYDFFNIVQVYQRPNGMYYIVDGMHRVVKAMLCGITEVPALVKQHAPGLSESEMNKVEAESFLASNRRNKKVSKNGNFKAGIFAKDPSSLQIERILRITNWTIKGFGAPNGYQISDYGHLCDSYKDYGKDVTVVASKLVQENQWRSTKPKPTFVGGVACFLKKIFPQLSEKNQVEFIDWFENSMRLTYTQTSFTEKPCYGRARESVAFRLAQRFNHRMYESGARRPITIAHIKELDGLSDEWMNSFHK
ncbi:ParB/RepB/Spo0J family partition protein [Synechococcus phage DSL-LC02]|nr:ParB/RepB/Spo0J family partition protein [Synechococcus phage DSL-LC02]